ncbi:RNA polymerase sigma-70 factor [Lishizhenia sp.]|uniref:RNA polymerase sigma-70 factor n=1 Tax=Lishizhenia sp. TaxID=2497594 RepID=UPI00299F34D0|nr:RNA polymerase sigma-70 factor [Lishizhenia sp.]MDX1444551.1 RNA polymerase sigma-70 factor [Lishizhenia sp.]
MELVEAITSQTLESWFNQYYESLARYAYTMVKRQEVAEDIVQKLFIKLWEKRKELEIKGQTKSYLYSAVHNASLNHLNSAKRKNSHREVEEDYSLSGSERTDSGIESKELEQTIELAMQTLPPKCREVFQLSRQEQLSYKEIADQLNISTKTVENQMGKALKLMRSALHEYLPAFIIHILILRGW